MKSSGGSKFLVKFANESATQEKFDIYAIIPTSKILKTIPFWDAIDCVFKDKKSASLFQKMKFKIFR